MNEPAALSPVGALALRIGQLLAYHLRDACRGLVVFTPQQQVPLRCTETDPVARLSLHVPRDRMPLERFLAWAAQQVAPFAEQHRATGVRVRAELGKNVTIGAGKHRKVLCGDDGTLVVVLTTWTRDQG
jgi:hypothetical protein